MDLTGIIGLISGLGLIVFGMAFSMGPPISFDIGMVTNFIDYPSIAITIGGTIAATVCSFPASVFKSVPKQLGIAFGKNKFSPQKYITTIVEFAQDARRKGILSLEDKVNEQKDAFLKKSIMLVVDAIEPEKTKTILENELNCIESRHEQGFKIFEKASGFGPAMGMIGTLIGLVNMLADLDLDAEGGASNLTSGMAVALITTFYGSLLSNLILTPIGNKLRYRHYEEMLCKEIIVEGVISIQAGDNPKHIEERLYAYLEANQRQLSLGDGESAGGGGGDEGEEAGGKGKKGKKKK